MRKTGRGIETDREESEKGYQPAADRPIEITKRRCDTVEALWICHAAAEPWQITPP
jgi:hypothetical protein